MFYIKYDTLTQWLTFSSAGHNQPLLYRFSDGSCHYLDAEGLIIGVKEDVFFEEKSILLDPGDILLLYTDGLTEAANSDGEMYGLERLSALLRKAHNEPLQNMIEIIYRDMIDFAGNLDLRDDVSIVAMRVERTDMDQQD